MLKYDYFVIVDTKLVTVTKLLKLVVLFGFMVDESTLLSVLTSKLLVLQCTFMIKGLVLQLLSFREITKVRDVYQLSLSVIKLYNYVFHVGTFKYSALNYCLKVQLIA